MRRYRSQVRKGSRTSEEKRNVQALTVTGPMLSLVTLYAEYCAAHIALTSISKLTSMTERREILMAFNAKHGDDVPRF